VPALVHLDNLTGQWNAPCFLVLTAPMPQKHNADRRHHIPKMLFKVQNGRRMTLAYVGVAA